MTNRKRFAALVLMWIALTAAPTQAQSSANAASKIDVFVGYSYLENSFGNRVGNHGYQLQGTWNTNRQVGFQADFSGHHGSTTPFSASVPATALGQHDDIYTVLFGPKLTYRANGFEIFLHFLPGIMHGRSSATNSGPAGTTRTLLSGTGFGLALGGGVDWTPENRRWAVRVLQLDYIHGNVAATLVATPPMATFIETRTPDNIRLSTGIIIRFLR